jgi:hypothetical protein
MARQALFKHIVGACLERESIAIVVRSYCARSGRSIGCYPDAAK